MSISSEDLARVIGVLEALRGELSKAVVGQRAVIDQTLAAFVASGHMLIEGVPGLGKTLLARALAKSMTLGFTRVQFTPDLMPTDITGHAVLDRDARGEMGGLGALRIVHGPVFTNLLLADEVNRAPAKTQSALLEVMLPIDSGPVPVFDNWTAPVAHAGRPVVPQFAREWITVGVSDPRTAIGLRAAGAAAAGGATGACVPRARLEKRDRG